MHRLLLLTVAAFFAWPLMADDSSPANLQVDELRLVARKLVIDNTELQCRLTELEAMTQKLVQQSAVTEAESKLAQDRAREAQQKADATVPLLTADEQKLQRELLDASQALQHNEELLKSVIAQNERLIGLMEEITKAAPTLSAELQARVVAEMESSRRWNETIRNEKLGVRAATAVVEAGTLKNARVINYYEPLHLVSLNLGSAQGVRLGMPFIIRRGDQSIALVRVVDVREQITGALVERVEKNLKPQKDDAAAVLTE